MKAVRLLSLGLVALSAAACWGGASDSVFRLDNDTGQTIYVEFCDGKKDVRVDAGGSCDIRVRPGNGEKFDVAFRFSRDDLHSAGCQHSINPVAETPRSEPVHVQASGLVPCRE